jgi:WD40 repeat protein
MTLATSSTGATLRPNMIRWSDSLPDLQEAIWLHILSFLDALMLCKVQQVCRSWHALALHTDLWQTLCIIEKIHCGPGIELIWER